MAHILMISLILLGVLVLAVPLIANVAGPFLVWRSQRIPTLVRFPPMDEQSFADAMTAEAVLHERAILELGFVKLDSSSLLDTHTTTFFRLYWNAEAETAAMVAISRTRMHALTYVELSQKYEDGSELDVSNALRPGAYPTLGHKLSFRLPRLATVAELLAAHTRLRRRFKPDAKPARFRPENGLHELEQGMRDESEALLGLGLVDAEIGDDGKRALTLRGAFAMTYRAVPPGRHLWSFITRRRAERALATA